MSEQAAAPAAATPAAPAAPAQAPAAAAPAALAPVPAPALAAPAPEAVVVQYSSTGDAALDLALNFIGKRGFGPERPEMVAAAQGDFSKLESSLKALGKAAEGYEPYLAAAKGSFQARQAAQAKAAEASQAIAVQVSGSVERWNSIHAWAKKVADPHEIVQIDAALKAGGVAAEAMVSKLSTLYAQSGEDKSPVASVVQAGAAGQEPTNGPLTATAYKQELAKLRRQYGDRLESREEFQKLNERRLAAIRNGQ